MRLGKVQIVGSSFYIKENKAKVLMVLVYESVTRPMKNEDMQHLERAERMEIRWNRLYSMDLNEWLGMVSIADVE